MKGIPWDISPTAFSFHPSAPLSIYATAYKATRGVVAVRAQEGLEELFHVEGQERWWEEIHLIQGKEQRLCFAGAAMRDTPRPR